MTLEDAVQEWARLEQQIQLLKVQQDRVMDVIRQNTSRSQKLKGKQTSRHSTKTTREQIIEALSRADRPLMPREMNTTGIPHPTITDMVRKGEIIRMKNGYKLAA